MGEFASWADAERESVGYGAPIILERTCASALKVKRGEAPYERDSVLFETCEYSFPVLAGLLRAALVDSGRLTVVDFGGALGTSYFQCRRFLQATERLEWCIIEQPAHVAFGLKNLEDAELRFYETVEDCMACHRPNALLLSSVLQYLPDPYVTLRRLLRLGLPHVIMDRTGFLESNRDRLTVQTVPEWIYPASYPAWFFSETNFTAAIAAEGYSLVTDFRRPDHDHALPPDGRAYYKGFIYEKTAAEWPPRLQHVE